MASRSQTRLEIIFVALVALNLRPFLAGPGPLLDQIGIDTGLSRMALSMITFGPLVLIGIGALATPTVQRRFGARPTILFALGLVAVGCFARIVPDGWVLLVTAALCGFGVALLQAIMPAAIRERFPERYGVITSVYSACLLAGGAVGAQGVPLIAAQTSWSVGLAMMGLLALLAMGVGIVVKSFDMAPLDQNGSSLIAVLASRRTWHLIMCFGALNASYATVITWLGPQFAMRGLTADRIGSLIAIMSLCQAFSALILPPLLSRKGDRRSALIVAVVAQAAGFGMLIFGTAPPLLIVLILGAGLGGTFSLMIIAILDCAVDRQDAVKLSAAVQGGGFILTAFAPLIAAIVMERLGGFQAVWTVHLLLLVLAVPLVLTMPRKQSLAVKPQSMTRCR